MSGYERRADEAAASGADEAERERRLAREDAALTAKAMEYLRPTGPTLGDEGPAVSYPVVLEMVEPEETLIAEGWRIRDLDELNRVLGRMARLERLQAENSRIVEAEVERLREWEAKENDALARRYRDLAAHVEVYARDNREALGKTRRLPNGTVAWREREEGYYRLDPNMSSHAARKALLEWSLEAEKGLDAPLTVHEPALDLDRVKEFLGAAMKEGPPVETPPGLEWVGPGESLSITTGGKKP